MNPFISGFAIGAVVAMFTALAMAVKMRKMADGYEMRIRARDTRIQLLINRVEGLEARERAREREQEELEKSDRRKATIETIKRPMR